MENSKFFHDQLLGNRIGNFSNRKVSCNQSHSEIILQKNHQGFSILSHTFFNIFRMSREMERIRLDIMLVDWSGYQHINQTVTIILQCSFQRIQSRFTGFRSSLGHFHFQFIFRTVQDVQFTFLCICRSIDDAEVGRNIHRLAMKGCYLRRTIHNRCAQFQHRSISEGFQDDFVSYPIDISVGDTHFYFSIVFHERLNFYIIN